MPKQYQKKPHHGVKRKWVSRAKWKKQRELAIAQSRSKITKGRRKKKWKKNKWLHRLPLRLRLRGGVSKRIWYDLSTRKTNRPFLRRKKFNRRLTIKITSNNVFCSLSSLATNKVFIVCSAGKYRIKTTKKRVKRTYRRILLIFLSKAWKYLNRGGIVVLITAPVRLRKKIIRFMVKLRSYRPTRKLKKKRLLLIKVQNKKCFNGCRSKKRRRKKAEEFTFN